MGVLSEVTPKKKDQFIEKIINQDDGILNSSIKEEAFELGISTKSIQLITNNLHDQGLVNRLYFMGGDFRVEITGRGIEFFQHGGFVGREILLEESLQKLILETEKLKKELSPDRLETVTKITSIIGNISTLFGLLSTR